MASLGYEVIVVDVDPEKIEQFNQGTVPFFEPGLTDLFRTVRQSQRLLVTTDLTKIADCDINFLCI